MHHKQLFNIRIASESAAVQTPFTSLKYQTSSFKDGGPQRRSLPHFHSVFRCFITFLTSLSYILLLSSWQSGWRKRKRRQVCWSFTGGFDHYREICPQSLFSVKWYRRNCNNNYRQSFFFFVHLMHMSRYKRIEIRLAWQADHFFHFPRQHVSADTQQHHTEIICPSQKTINSQKTDGILVWAKYIFQVLIVEEDSHIDPCGLIATLILLDTRDRNNRPTNTHLNTHTNTHNSS